MAPAAAKEARPSEAVEARTVLLQYAEQPVDYVSMSRLPQSSPRPVDPADALNAANSWKGKYIRDAYERQIGLVHSVGHAGDGEYYLLARFPHESEDRTIYLDPRDDLNYTAPGHVRARYRPPTAEDLEKVRAALDGRPSEVA